jgi:YggT family protein
MSLLINAVGAFADIIIILLLARAIGSWFARPGGGGYNLYRLLETLTEPIVAPCRAITSKFQTGMFDFSVILAFFLVMAVRTLIISILTTLS